MNPFNTIFSTGYAIEQINMTRERQELSVDRLEKSRDICVYMTNIVSAAVFDGHR